MTGSYTRKVVVLGDNKAGKSCLINRYIEDNFKKKYEQTIGANFKITDTLHGNYIERAAISEELKLDIVEKGFRFYLWEISGARDKLFSNEYFFAYTHAAIICLDLTDIESLNGVDFWITKLRESCGNIPIILAGTKLDCKKKVVIREEDIKKKAETHNCNYWLTSAKRNTGIDEMLQEIIILMLNNKEK